MLRENDNPILCEIPPAPFGKGGLGWMSCLVVTHQNRKVRGEIAKHLRPKED